MTNPSTIATRTETHRMQEFQDRHIGPNEDQTNAMLAAVGQESLDALCNTAVPGDIHLKKNLNLPAACSEHEALQELHRMASKNRVFRSCIGMGYHDCLTPAVIQRNILENPGWYTQYTPYQPEISQGRLEALLNFQTMVCDLTAMEIANGSLLDEATAAAEAMTMCHRVCKKRKATKFFVANSCHPQTIAIVQTRALPLGIDVVVGDPESYVPDDNTFAALLQYPDTHGQAVDGTAFVEKLHAVKALAIFATDLMALALLKPPGEMGADAVVGNSQRFGVPLGFGGPHAAFLATRDAFKRNMPGRVVGVSIDAAGRPAYRLAMQTREQHIRRDKATSNICTAQVLLAIIASTYAVYHGPEGIRAIANRIHSMTRQLAASLAAGGWNLVGNGAFFDTIVAENSEEAVAETHRRASERHVNFRKISATKIGIALDETITDLNAILDCFGLAPLQDTPPDSLPNALRRTSSFLDHEVFHTHHSETKLLRYLRRLESKDLSLTTSMIPLGSCTMKLNATSEMLPVTWREFGGIHPFAPAGQTAGYSEMFNQLENWLAEITGFDAVSLQPNAGSQGEYAGLLAIRGYHQARGDHHRQVCLIPLSAHGTNPASAVMAGMNVVPVQCDEAGNIDMDDLRSKAGQHADSLAALMVTYPSTHGVFESTIRSICDTVHQHGGLVYMDGANMNAQVGLCRPGDFGADVCHLNLHKTFCIPHGGGGPGVGPIAVAAHLADFLPGWIDPETGSPSHHPVGPVSASRWGSASILPISWFYIRTMGAHGLRRATQTAILNANYVARRLSTAFPILYTGRDGLVAHECIVDCRPLKETAGIEVEDISKRLIDYGFHAPTMSWPVAGTLMVEPTESEDQEELDRFCDAMLAIHREAIQIADGSLDPVDNPLKNAPHTALDTTADNWNHPYSRELAAYPATWTRTHKFWPAVSRIDNVYGDRNLVCSCPSIEEMIGN